MENLININSERGKKLKEMFNARRLTDLEEDYLSNAAQLQMAPQNQKVDWFMQIVRDTWAS